MRRIFVRVAVVWMVHRWGVEPLAMMTTARISG